MKPSVLTVLTVLILAALALFSPARAHEDHKHDQPVPVKKSAGPNGGRILTSVTPHAEFFVTKERKIQFTFLDDHGQPVVPAGQIVTVTTGSRSAPTVLTFTRQNDALLSDAALPAGNNLPAVIQLKPAPDAKVVVEKFNINLATCGECRLAEYACTCDH